MVRMTRETPATTQAARLSAVAAGTTGLLMPAKLWAARRAAYPFRATAGRGATRSGSAALCGRVRSAKGKGRVMASTIPSSAFSAHAPVRPDWLAKRREAALEPDLPIVDPHHHLIDRPENGTYLLRDLLADID